MKLKVVIHKEGMEAIGLRFPPFPDAPRRVKPSKSC